MEEAEHDLLNKLDNEEYIFPNNPAEPMDIKDIIKIEETVIYDGTNYLNNENFSNIKLEASELSTYENCDEYKKEQLDELSNSIYKENDFPNQENSNVCKIEKANENSDVCEDDCFSNRESPDEQQNRNEEQVPTSNSKELPVDIKMMIEIGKTNFFDGSTHLKYENCGIKTDPEQSTLDICYEYVSEKEVEEVKDIICEDGEFSNQESLDGKQLNQNEFSEKLDESERQPNIKEGIIKCVSGKRIQCQFCDSTTTTRAGMKKHIEVIHFGMKNHKCQYCDYTSYEAATIRAHVNFVHHNIRNHKCQYCDFATSLSSGLKRHINDVHNKVKNHKCELCDYATSRLGQLKRHTNAVHHKIKNHKCEYCDFAASRPSLLKTHINSVHLKIRNHKCEYCDHTAYTLSDIKIHTNAVHHKIKNHKCQYCDYASSQSRQVKTHINTVHHKIKNHKCEYCDFAASTSGNLRNHLDVVHHNIKNHKCTYCDYAAGQLGQIKTHINAVHHKIRNQKCEYCDFAATTRGNLRRHIRAHHKI